MGANPSIAPSSGYAQPDTVAMNELDVGDRCRTDHRHIGLRPGAMPIVPPSLF